MRTWKALALAAAMLLPAGMAWAQAPQLTIARQVSTTAMDPGFLREAATIVDNIFDTLVMRDKDMRLVPGLAESWTPIDDTTSGPCSTTVVRPPASCTVKSAHSRMRRAMRANRCCGKVSL